MNTLLHLEAGRLNEFASNFVQDKNKLNQQEIISYNSLNNFKNSESLEKCPKLFIPLSNSKISNPSETDMPVPKKIIEECFSPKKKKCPKEIMLKYLNEKKQKEKNNITIDFQKLSPILENNLKMFLRKLRYCGSLNNLCLLTDYDRKLMNDNAFCEEEKKIGFSLINMLQETLNFIYTFFSAFLKKIVKNNQFHIHVIHPYHKFKLIWDLLNAAIILFLLFYIPLYLSFNLNSDNFKVENKIIFAIFIVDIFVEMNTLYFDHGIEVKDRKRIIKNYMSKYLLSDALAVFSLVPLFLDLTEFSVRLALLFLIKMVNLSKISKIMMNRFQLNYQAKGIKDLLYLFIVIILITHYVACIWYYVGRYKMSQNEQNWINYNDYNSNDLSVQYMTSFYWAIVTVMTVGYGDITPRNDLERFVCLLTILFGGMIFPYSINSIGVIIQDLKKNKIKYNNTLDVINSYMIRKGINSKLQTRIREYLKFIWREEKSQNFEEEEKIINSLSNSLKEELLLEAYGFFLKNNPLFTRWFSETSLKKLVYVMKEVLLTPDDIVFLESQQNDNPAIYFIGKGNIRLYSKQKNENDSSFLLKELGKGEYFGEQPFFTNMKRENSAISSAFSTLFLIYQNDFIRIIKESKPDYENFLMIKDKLLLYNDYEAINKNCFSCRKFNHTIEECPKLHFVPDKEKIIKKFNFPLLNGRMFYKRTSKKTVHSLCLLRSNFRGYMKIKKTLFNNPILSISKEDSSDGDGYSYGEVPEEESITNIHNTKQSSDEDVDKNTWKCMENYMKSKNEFNTEDIYESSKVIKAVPNIVSVPSLLDNKKNSNLEFKKEISNEFSDCDQQSHRNKISSTTKKIDSDNDIIKIKKEYKPTIKNENSLINQEIEFDRVYNFQNYFPEYNISNLIKNQWNLLNLEKEIIKKYVTQKYCNFKHYVLSPNIVLEKFLKEAKDIKQKKKSIHLSKHKSIITPHCPTSKTASQYEKNLASSEKNNFNEYFTSMRSRRQSMQINKLKTKNFFTKQNANNSNRDKINNFQELIHAIIQKQKEEKN